MPFPNVHIADIFFREKCKFARIVKELKVKQIVHNFVQQLNTLNIFRPLTQNMIEVFKSRAQTIFSLLEKTSPPPAWFTKFENENFFSLFYIRNIQRSYTYKKLDTNNCFSNLGAISDLFSSFIHPVRSLYSIGERKRSTTGC